ncbi:hypothetical protein [Corynebacterium pilosum]|uniref:Uncharacterized protein n=2 Tax=Corynebacterium pilosum TaxID=35756 RepID=A0A376CKY6_9CORY|nr:hypothetical protein [Corynebacterium pilosum]STC68847.1 Uncharacterised protein [Corynebacterium pilosum]
MHRKFLQFWDVNGAWQVHNMGSRLVATFAATGNSEYYTPLRLSPGQSLPVPLGYSTITFETPMMAYEMEITNARTARPPRQEHPGFVGLTEHHFEPTEEQFVLLRALALPVLQNPTEPAHQVVPGINQLAEELGWSEKKTNRKMANIVDALAQAGVPEFQPGPTRVNWRIPLARYAAEVWGHTLR